MLFSSLAACLKTRNTVWCLVPINYFVLVIVKLNINLYTQCVKIRLNDILDFRYDPNLKDKKKKKNEEIRHFSKTLLILHTNIKPANVSDKIVSYLYSMLP